MKFHNHCQCNYVSPFHLMLFSMISCVVFVGILIRSLSCEELEKTKNVHDLSFSDDETTLALACRGEGVKLFTVKRQCETNAVFSG